PITGISISNSTAKSLAGGAPSLAFESIAGFTLTGNWATERRAALDVRYSLLGGTLIGDKVIDAVEAIDLVHSVDTTTADGHPSGDLGAAPKDAAALAKGNIRQR